MAIDMDDEILQDFLVEAQEILESLGEQLVELEQTPDDNELLNAVFRGFHTIKGGAGFLELTSMVNICHHAEDIFNLLRQGERKVDALLMDVILKSLDAVNGMFDELTSGNEPSDAPPELLAQLESLMAGEVSEVIAEEEAADEVDVEFDAMLDGATSDGGASTDEITDDEFESLLDDLQGNKAQNSTPSPSASDEINDEEFDDLLDKIHGKGKHTTPVQSPSSGKTENTASENIDEAEFEQLLDSIHGKGKHGLTTKKSAEKTVEKPVVEVRPAKKDTTPPIENSSRKDDSGKSGSQQETTVRVATKRLDEIMNMVGELVLVRNRLKTLEGTRNDEELSKVISSLDVVTGDLQMSAMRTRMQPIKKVFGRFPRVVRDLARSLNKDIKLEMEGEETDLDKNLVEALADPLVHLVRNSVDHGIETPEVRKAAGKPATGTINLSAVQEGDHILLSIADDGAGMNADVLRKKAVEKGIMDE
ncbi:MAG TPA: chemotaxis protein CheA, partial [Gammaproteobacteria bacterium]|nr:chemotaxis protein CheA [Gammaproteobacteria bacterium]